VIKVRDFKREKAKKSLPSFILASPPQTSYFLYYVSFSSSTQTSSSPSGYSRSLLVDLPKMDMEIPEPLLEKLLPPKNLSHHFSNTTLKRKASSIKQYYKFFNIPGIKNLAGGKK